VTVGTAAQYATQHIPGAQLLNSSTELLMTRMEGVGSIGTMVLDGPSMDSLIQRLCIDGRTTIVFVAEQEPELAERDPRVLHLPLLGLPEGTAEGAQRRRKRLGKGRHCQRLAGSPRD
jgi:hypothetical protein